MTGRLSAPPPGDLLDVRDGRATLAARRRPRRPRRHELVSTEHFEHRLTCADVVGMASWTYLPPRPSRCLATLVLLSQSRHVRNIVSRVTSTPRPLTGLVGRALVELARPAGPGDPGPIAIALERGKLESLSALVFYHRLDAPFVDVVRRLGTQVPDGHLVRIAENRVTRMRVLTALVELARILDDHQIDWVVVKGPVVSRRMRHPEHRAFNDLDLVVVGADLEPALNALSAAGADELNHNWDAYIRHEVGEVPLSFGGVPLDLHWSLVGLGAVRRTMQLPTDVMVRRRVKVELNGHVEVPALDPVDELLHLCVHSALAGAARLDQLRDIAVVAGTERDLDWDLFVRRARSALVAPLVAHALDRAANVLGASIPRPMVEQMGGASLRIGRWIDSTGAPDRARLRGVHVKSARNDRRARWRARQVLVRAEFTRRMSPEHSWDFADPRSVLYQGTDAGGADARRTFIELAR